MGETVMLALQDIAYLAGRADSVEKRRALDLLMESTATYIETKLEGAESIKTAFGTAYTKSRTSCSVKDREAFYKFALETDNLGAIDMKANAKAVRELNEAGTVVPGVNYSETLVVGVRRPKQ